MGDQAYRRPIGIARRAVLAAPPALLGLSAARAAAPQFPNDCQMLAAGPVGGALAMWADRLAEAIRAAAPNAPLMIPQVVGGEDGVTASNQFATRVAPDGLTALLAPGAAGLARLSGDPRVQFDPGNWLAITVGVAPGVCASRIDIARMRPGATLRVAASGPAGPELALLLAVELLGLTLEPVFGLGQRDAAARALGSGAVDAVFVHGPGSQPHLAALAASGVPGRVTLGLPNERGWQRDPQIQDVPTLPEWWAGRNTPDDLTAAWQGAAVAAQIEFALVLQALSPAHLVAQWRSAGDVAAETLRGAVADVQVLSSLPATAAVKALAPNALAIVELRRWLLARFKWQPE